MSTRRVWWVAAAVFLGLGTAVLAGTGIAHADDEAPDTTKHSVTSSDTSPTKPTGVKSRVAPAARVANRPQAVQATGSTQSAQNLQARTKKRLAAATAAVSTPKTADADQQSQEAAQPSDESTVTTTATLRPRTVVAENIQALRSLAAPVANAPPKRPKAAQLALNVLSVLAGATTSQPTPTPTDVPTRTAPVASPTGPATAQATVLAAPSTDVPTGTAPVASPTGPATAQATVLAAPSTSGVTGVTVGHSNLTIPVEPNGFTARADWYFPTQADGSVKPQGVILLQHGFLANKNFYSALATQLAQQTNSIVVVPTLPSFPLRCRGCSLNGAQLQQATATMFAGPPENWDALNQSAQAAGYDQPTLPGTFVLTGHSAGGGFATAVGGYYTAALQEGDQNNLAGIVMFDGVSTGDSLQQAMVGLNEWNVPVYQIAAPAQTWNAFGTTTEALVAARQGQFVGDVLVGGSHVDSMLGGNPIVDFAAQLVTKFSPAGNTAAVYTLATGWINDFYAGAGPADPQYGFYGLAGQQVIMGEAAAVVLPSSVATQLSPFQKVLKKITGKLFSFLFGGSSAAVAPAAVPNASAVPPVPTPSQTNGVTGVQVGHSDLYIPVSATDGYTAKADWYFPTQADGSVQPQGVIYLQHGFLGRKSWYSALATQLAQQTNSVVVAPNLPWFQLPWNCEGCSLNGAAMAQGVAALFAPDGRGYLNISASQAGYQAGTLPDPFLLTGHSAGGSLAAAAGGYYVHAITEQGGVNQLQGVIMYDGVSDPEKFAQALNSLGDTPVYQISARPQAWNNYGETTEQLAFLRQGEFVGVQLDNGSHVDSLIGGNRIIDFVSQLLIGRSPPGNTEAVYTLASGWINDLYGGYTPANPKYGVYGPTGPYTGADQKIVLGEAGGTTLPAPPPVSVDPNAEHDFLGTWYEVGSVKLPFEWFLVNTKAEYSLNPDGTIRVRNSGNLLGPNGPEISIVGSAVPRNAANTRLRVNFFLPANFGVGPGNYWILDYQPEYQWAIVSDSTGFTGFILSRDPNMSDAEYQQLVARARQLGVWGPITRTKQFPQSASAVTEPVPATVAA